MAANQFMLFGHDVRDYGRMWLAAWQDFLLGDDSPIRRRLDAAVAIEVDGSVECWQGGERCLQGADSIVHEAIALPDDYVLSRTIFLPAAVDAELDNAIALEVSAHSPFAPDDTAAGWSVSREGDEHRLVVKLCIVSRAAVMSYLGRTFDIHDPKAREVWALIDRGWVTLRGFGEGARTEQYRRRLVRVSSMLAAVLVLALTLAGSTALLAGMKLSKLERLQAETLQEAKSAMALRDELARASATVSELNTLAKTYPNPHEQLRRLTTLIPDTAYLTQFNISGRDIRIRGRGTEAAGLMQSMTERPIYASVTAPQAITRVGNAGQEQFYIDIKLAAGTR